MRRYFFLLLLPWVASMTLQAFPSLVLKDEMIYATVRGQYLGIYEDERQLGIQDVMRFPSDSFYVVYKIPTNKNKKAVYWLCFKLDNQDAKDKKWLLEFFDHHINEVALYTTKADGSIEKIRSGDRMAFSQRKFWHKNIVFDLNLPYRQSKTYYIRIKSENENVIMPELRSYERFISYALSEYYLLGLFYGILLVMALYNFLLFLAIRRVTYLYYVLYVLSMIFQTMCLNGLGFQFVWPKHPWINGIGMDLSVFMTMLFSVMFTKDFLHFERHFPKVTRMLNLMLMLRAISVIVGVVFFPTWGASWRWLDLIPFTITCVAAITCFVREDSTSRYFVIAFTLVYVMLTINILEMYGLIWSDIFTVYSLNIGIVLEIIFLSISLADQLRREIRQKEVAQAQLIEQMKQSELISQRVNRELEAKVRQRTIELNEANEKLKTQVKDTTLMNLQLDTQNWNLRKDVTEIAQKRILRPVVDLKEFS
ncbi:MAG TPA: 7TM diverse intracellular signaling domain-containing protein, partial [Cytophagales bacterium]|nr:7TM diverse intracellular signaling domain-containing protein [Cytophagales bacterium]